MCVTQCAFATLCVMTVNESSATLKCIASIVLLNEHATGHMLLNAE